MKLRSVFTAGLLAAIAACAQAATLLVPGTYATVQLAVDAAGDGDEVHITAAGTYAGDVTVASKNISIIGDVAGVIIGGKVTSNGTSVLALNNFEVTGAGFDGVQQNSAGILSLNGVNIHNNPGRGLYHTVATTVTMTNSNADNNGFDGYNSPALDSVLIADNCTFNGNSRKGLFAENNAQWKISLTDCFAQNNANEDNFIATQPGTLNALRVTFANTTGGFAQVRFDSNANATHSKATFTDCTFSGATGNGSLWFLHPTDVTVTGCQFINSFRGIAFDGTASSCTLNVTDSTFTGLSYRGIGTGQPLTATITDSTFTNNTRAMEFGGSASTVDISNTTVTGSTSAGILFSGSGVKAVTLTDVSISGTTAGPALDFSGNVASPHTLLAKRSSFVDGSGASQYLVDAQDVQATFENCIFDGGSYLVRQEGTSAFSKVHFSTLVSGDNASTVGYFVQTANAGNEIIDSIISGPQYGIAAATGLSAVTNHHNLINAATANFDVVTPGANNILSVAPQFVTPSSGPGTGDLHLQAGSPALGQGTDLGVAEDLDGGARPLPIGSNPDLGAYENLLVPVELSDFTLD